MVAGGLPKKVAVPKTGSVRAKSRKRGSAPALAKLKSTASTFGRLSKRTADNTLFCRYELKYRISESKAEAIEQFIKPYIHLDRYAKLQPDRTYPIASLYLDSQDLKLCRESLTGKKNRFKLRIRSYSDDPDTPCFVEIKRRLNNIIIKGRVRVTNDNVATLLSGRSLPAQQYKADEHTLRQFQLYMHCINAGPVIGVRYKRRAYEDDSDNRVRVTFDRQLCYHVSREPVIMFNDTGWQRHRHDSVVLELKFTSRYPAWLSRMVKYFDLQRQSVSKYASSIKESCSRGLCSSRLSV
jgi:hypothetical protein